MVRTKKAYNFVNRGWEEAFGIEFLGSDSDGFSFLILKALLARSTALKKKKNPQHKQLSPPTRI